MKDAGLQELRGFLQKKFHPGGVIDSSFNRALQLSCADLPMDKVSIDNSSNLTFAFTNNGIYILDSVRHAAEIILPSDRIREVLSDRKIIAAKR